MKSLDNGACLFCLYCPETDNGDGEYCPGCVMKKAPSRKEKELFIHRIALELDLRAWSES